MSQPSSGYSDELFIKRPLKVKTRPLKIKPRPYTIKHISPLPLDSTSKYHYNELLYMHYHIIPLNTTLIVFSLEVGMSIKSIREFYNMEPYSSAYSLYRYVYFK